MTEFTKYPFLINTKEEEESRIEDKLFSAAQLLSSKGDQITGLTLKQFFADDLYRRIYESGRYEVPVCVCLVSVEEIAPNGADEQEVASSIRCIAEFLESFIRQSDLPTWYSPNEFLISMPHLTSNEARAACQRIGTALNELLKDQSAHASVTAEQVKPGDVLESILERLHDNLYSVPSS